MSRSRISFPLQMAIGAFLGILIGLFFGERCAILEPWANAYVMILKVTAIPYLFLAIIHGVGLLNGSQALQILKKGMIFIALILFVNISIIYLIYWSLPAAEGPGVTAYFIKEIPPLNFAKMLIPENVFFALSNNVIPAVVVFSLLVGIALIYLSDKQPLMSTLESILSALTKVTKWIARITPVGTFLIIASQVGTVQFSTIKQMSTYIILYVIGTCLVTFWIVPRIASSLSTIKARTWLKNLAPILVLGYTTNLTIVTIPYMINIIKQELQRLYPKDENVQGQIQGTVTVIFNLPLGSIFTAAFVLFLSVFYSHHLELSSHIKLFFTTFLTSLGAVGIGSWINSLTFILDALGIPIDGVNMYLAIVPFTAGFQTMISVMVISTLGLLITLAGRGLLRLRLRPLLINSVITALPVLLIFFGINYFDPLPRIKNQQKTIFELEIESDTSVRVLTAAQANEESVDTPAAGTLQRILATKTLRVGYDPKAIPFSFENKYNKLVGFDIAYAYQLAFDLGCRRLEFIPIQNTRLSQQLEAGQFDIAMSSTSISTERLKSMCFPKPTLEPKIVFVVRDNMRKQVQTLKAVRKNKELKIGAQVNTSYAGIAYNSFPDHQIILIESYDAFAQANPPIDILIWEEHEAIAWAVNHPEYHVIYPTPNLGKESLGYPIRYGDPEFLCYMNSWLGLKEADGFKKEQIDLWIYGKTHSAAPPKPRWSILDNLLGWKRAP